MIGFRAYGRLPHTTLPFTVDASRHVIDLIAVRDSTPERIAAAHLLPRDLVQAFGLAEPRHLTATGELRAAYFNSWPQAWAEANGVGRSSSVVT